MPRQQSAGTESNLKRSVMKMLAKEFPAAQVRKRHGSVYSTAGDPDLYILSRGVHIECELKQPGQEPTPLQAHRLEAWRQAGALVAVVHTVAEMRAVMDSLGRPVLASAAR
jgi:hypothetical protein